MQRAIPLALLLAASPAVADSDRPFNTFDGRLEVDAISGGMDVEETAKPETTPDGAASQPELAPAKEPLAEKQVAILEPITVTEVRDIPPPLPRRHTRPTPRFDLAAGPFLQTRGLDFDYDPYLDESPPSYEDSLQGLAVAAAVYPFPTNQADGKLSGVGFTLKLAQSIGGTIVGADETGYGEYVLQHSTLDAAVHYRHLVDKFAIDGEVAYGTWRHTIVDLPESIAVPDTSYQYLAAGIHADVYPTERASIGATIRYLRISSSGDVMSEDWYGSGDAHGWVLGGNVVIPLPKNLQVRAGVEWRKITLDLEGSGYLAYEWGVWTIEDTALTGSALLGLQF
jgi:hypothetical protein